jgi:Tol biopolymer transport system component
VVGAKSLAYVRETGTGNTRVVCEGCVIRDFFSRPPGLLVQSGSRLVREDEGGGEQRLLLDAAGRGRIFEAALSPSERRIAFTLARPDGTAALLVADASRPAPADGWTRVAEDRNYLGALSWSHDGRVLYFGSTRDAFVCIWAQRFDAEGRPEGEPVAAFHNHTLPNMLLFGASRMSASRDRLYMLLADFKGDLWSLKLLR